MATIEERVQELADKDEIRELTARYCLAVAEGDFVDDPARMTDPAWSTLPARRKALAIEVIASDAKGRWRLVWRQRGRGSTARIRSGRRRIWAAFACSSSRTRRTPRRRWRSC